MGRNLPAATKLYSILACSSVDLQLFIYLLHLLQEQITQAP